MSLQKESLRLKNELDEAKSQLVVADLKIQNDILVEKRKAEEEIASLQQVIHETVEESSCSRKQLVSEVSKLQLALSKLQEENALLKTQLPRDPPTDGPQISLSTVTKTLARKVASQLGADSLSLGPDNLEESMRKVKKYVRNLKQHEAFNSFHIIKFHTYYIKKYTYCFMYQDYYLYFMSNIYVIKI